MLGKWWLLTRILARAPIIKECVVHLECKLVQTVPVGDHTLFIDEVLAAYVNESILYEKFNVKKVGSIYHVGGDDFVTISSRVVTPSRPMAGNSTY